MTFDFYRNTFGGCALREEEFCRLAPRAERFVRNALRGRWDAVSLQDPDALLCAVCAVAEILLDEESAFTSSIEKESVGDYAVTYRTGSTQQAALLERRKTAALQLYLAGVPALAGLFAVKSFPCSHRIL